MMISKSFFFRFCVKDMQVFSYTFVYKNRDNLIIEINQAHVINVYFKRNRLVVTYSTNVKEDTPSMRDKITP